MYTLPLPYMVERLFSKDSRLKREVTDGTKDISSIQKLQDIQAG